MEVKNPDNNTNKITSKKRTKYDIIEKKDIELNHIKQNTNDIKKSSIKQFIYSNRNVPKVWKTKKNYKNLVLDLFANDNNFIKYLGNNESDKNLTSNINLKRPKTSIVERNSNLNFDSNKKQKLTYNKLEESKKKIRTLMSPQIEMENIFEDLKEKYPIKKKLGQLFPYYNFEEDKKDKRINFSYDNQNVAKKSMLVENSIAKSKLKKIKKMEKNIYNNLFLKNKNIAPLTTKLSRKQIDDFDYKRKNRVKLMRKELNDPRIFNLLQNVNLYGPYFSYCPLCFDKNVDFYKNIGRKQCLSLLNYIKSDNYKNMEIQETKFRNNLKHKNEFF